MAVTSDRMGAAGIAIPANRFGHATPNLLCDIARHSCGCVQAQAHGASRLTILRKRRRGRRGPTAAAQPL